MPYRPNFPIPSEIDPPRTCLCIPIPDSDEWRAIVAGLFTELTYWYNYERTGDTSGAQCALVWKEIFSQIDWGRMSCCCGEFDVIFQWTVDGVLQRSTDGGVTWVDSPQDDPRNSSPTYPPVPGEPSDDKKCVAATSMRDLIEQQVGDQLTDDMARFTLQELIETWVTTIIQTSNPFQALINIAVNQIFALTIALVRPALTDGVYDDLTCVFFNNMSDDLSFDDAQWEQVRSDILSVITGIAGVFLEHLVFLLGKVGLTNLARSQAAIEGDCSACSEGCADLFTVTFGTELARTADSIVVRAAFNAPDGVYHAQISSGDMDICCNANWSTPTLEANRVYYPCGLPDTSAVFNGPVPPVTQVWLIDETSGSTFDIEYVLT